jgi:DNA-binding MarR family transcriptional regulator
LKLANAEDKLLKKNDKEDAAGDAQTISFGPLEKRLGYALRRAQLAVFSDFFDAFAQSEIRPAQYSVLTIIESNPGLPQGRVAEVLGIQKTNFVGMISALEERGFVRREASKQDRRIYGLYLTAAGTRLMKKLHKTAEEHEQHIADRLGEAEYRRLFDPLRKLADGL